MNDLNDIARASVRGGLILFLGNTLSHIIFALTSIIVARLLGPEDYGLYSVILIVPSFLVTLSGLGISPALLRFTANFQKEGEKRKTANIIKVGTIFQLISSIIISLFFFLVSKEIAIHILNRPGIDLLLRITPLYIIGQVVLYSVSSTFIGLDEAEKSSFLMNTRAVIKSLASLLFIILGLGVTGAVIGTGLGSLFAATIGVAILLLRTYPKLKEKGVQSENINFPQELEMMISYGAPLYLSYLIESLRVQLLSILLTLFMSNIDIGNYKIATNFSTFITVFASSISISLFSAFSKLNVEKDRNSIEKMFKLSVKYTSLIIIPASIAISLLSKNIVDSLYGSQYQTSPGYLSLYILGFLCTSLGEFVIRPLFNGQGDTRTTLKVNSLNTVSSISLASILIPKHGVPGLIASVLISKLISNSYGLYQIKRMYRISLEWTSAMKILTASLSSFLLSYFLVKLTPITNPIYILTLGGTVYLTSFIAFAPIFGAVNEKDLENLENLTHELPIVNHITRYILRLEKKILELNFASFDTRVK